MLANAKHEIKFHGTIPLDSFSFEPRGTIPNGVPRCEEQPTESGRELFGQPSSFGGTGFVSRP
jgi:hypothetical protein